MTAVDVRVAEIAARAELQARAYARMVELGGGVGLLGVRHPQMFEDSLTWANATENEHADTVLWLIDRYRDSQSEVCRLRPVVEDAEAELVTVKQQRSDNLRAIAERDAVITEAHKACGYCEGHGYVRTAIDDARPCDEPMHAALEAAPESVLAARDADKWDEGARYAYEELTGKPEQYWLTPGENPYRAGAGQ